jgi:hypothetical protein
LRIRGSPDIAHDHFVLLGDNVLNRNFYIRKSFQRVSHMLFGTEAIHPVKETPDQPEVD